MPSQPVVHVPSANSMHHPAPPIHRAPHRDCQDCVEGTQCIELSRDVAGRIADVGCEYANSQCQPQQAVAASLQVRTCATRGHRFEA